MAELEDSEVTAKVSAAKRSRSESEGEAKQAELSSVRDLRMRMELSRP
jgi:hypothetical protein